MFAIEPTISVEKIISTKDGVVLDVPIAQGELVLIAKNIIDGAEYYSTSIELEGESLGSKDKAMKSMIKGIKVTDPAYKQFINTARKKIEEYYSTNCAFILQKAKALYNQQRYKEAISYLSAATANIPCYDQAYALQEQILAKFGTKPDTVIVEKVVENTELEVIHRDCYLALRSSGSFSRHWFLHNFLHNNGFLYHLFYYDRLLYHLFNNHSVWLCAQHNAASLSKPSMSTRM